MKKILKFTMLSLVIVLSAIIINGCSTDNKADTANSKADKVEEVPEWCGSKMFFAREYAVETYTIFEKDFEVCCGISEGDIAGTPFKSKSCRSKFGPRESAEIDFDWNYDTKEWRKESMAFTDSDGKRKREVYNEDGSIKFTE